MSIAHGTISCYTNRRCRCDECRTAWNSYRRLYWHDAKEGTRTVPVAETRAYIKRLLAAGHSHTSIAALSGLSRTAIGRIAAGDFERVRRGTESAILGVEITAIAPGHNVPVTAILPAIDAAGNSGVSMRRICRSAAIAHRYVPRRGRIGWNTFRRLEVVLRIAVRDRVLPGDVLDGIAS